MSRSSSHEQQLQPDLAPQSTPPQLPTRRNIYDDDELDRLAVDTSKISFGKRPGKSADQLLRDGTTAPAKAAILSALATFDMDDDERDDTYDADDVGGTVDASANQEAEANGANDAHEETLFRAFQADPRVFDRDAATRRSAGRNKLRGETGMADEMIEAWALMLTRNAGQMRRLEAKYAFSGQQTQLGRTAWRDSPAGSGAEDSDRDAGAGGAAGRGGRGGGGNGRGRGGGGTRGGRGGGNVAGPTGEKSTENARKNKEANKGSRANHNRKAGHAKKMARGGFPG